MESTQEKYKLPQSPLVREHSPGPPAAAADVPLTGSTTDKQQRFNMDDRLGKELVQKEEELQRLRTELQTYVMKVRGYQTLEHLLHESKQECTQYKQECTRYKQKHDDLALKLDNLTKRLNTTQTRMTVEESSGGKNAGSTAVGLHSGNWNMSGKDMDAGKERNGSPVELMGRSLDGTGAAAGMELGGSGRTVTPGSTASSPSFVRIDSTSTEQSPTSLVSGNFGERSNAKQAEPPRSLSSHNQPELSCASLEVQQLTDLVRNLNPGEDGGDTSLVQDLSSNLIRTGISVRNLEKQNRVQKVMIDQMSATIDEVTQRNEVLQQTIDKLQAERNQLQAVVNELTVARENAIREARKKFIDSATAPSEPQSAAFSGDWVEVEKRPAADGAGGAPGNDEVQVTAVSTVEMELRKRIEKLNATICELVTVNRSWDEHCKKLEQDHGQQVAALTNDLGNFRRRIEELGNLQRQFDELKQIDERKQVEFDQFLLNAKKQREIEEMAKEEALNQLHQEKRHRASVEEHCSELNHRIVELEQRVHELQSSKQSAMEVGNIAGGHASSNLSAGDRDMELEILREQMAVFKEDFDHERRDREAARETSERLQATLNNKTAQLEDAQTKLLKALEELKQAKNDSIQFRNRFERVAEEIKVLQRQTRPQPSTATAKPPARAAGSYATAPTPVQFSPTHVQPAYPPSRSSDPSWSRPAAQFAPPHFYQPSSMTGWPCSTCTFLNPDTNVTCSMCGRMMRELQLQPRSGASTFDVGGRSGAGLPNYSPTLYNGSSSSWPPLPHGSLETDRPSPSV